MPRHTSFIAVIRNLVREEVLSAMQTLLGLGSKTKGEPKKGRRRRRKARGKWRPGGPGRPPKAVAAKASRKK